MPGLKIIISGGGTGGHIFPAVAVANAFKALHPEAEILFVGARGKMEMEKVPKAGYPIIGLPIRGLQRKLTLRNLAVPFRLISSLWTARKTIKEFDPQVVVGFGGYASAAVVYMASRMGRKTLIQEQNSYPGITNKILANRVDRICVAFEGMEAYFPKEKIILTGNPIRQDIIENAGKRNEGLQSFQLDPGRKTLLALGGSLGARTINRAMLQLAPALEALNAQLIWQCGSIYFREMKGEMASAPNSRVHLLEFIERMDLAYAVADVVISRSGALSVSEITALKKPSVLIPSPHVAEDHQTKNAESLAKYDAAILLKDSEGVNKIVETVQMLTTTDHRLSTLRNNLEKMFTGSHAARQIAEQIFQLAGK